MTGSELIGQCFTLLTSWGDGGETWRVYLRVRAVIAGYAECYRFETRASMNASGPMFVMYPCCPMATDLLKRQVRITVEEWTAEREKFLRDCNELDSGGLSHGNNPDHMLGNQ